MQRTLGTILLAVLVVLAGCGGVLGGGSDEKVTLTPAPVPTAKPTPTPVPQLAPGLTRQGIENTSALVAAHTSFLQNRSFTVVTNMTALASNGSVVARGMSTIRAGPMGEGVYSVSKWNKSYEYPNIETVPVRTEVWSNSSRLFLKRTYANGTTTYNRFSSTNERYGATGAGLLRLPFGTANTSVVKRFTKNGTTLYRVRGTTRTDRTFMGGNASISLRLLVDSRGVIHEYRIVRRRPSQKNISTFIYEVQFSKIGTTDAPERPSWVDEAINQTTPIRPVETTRDSE